jgi:hexokinase
MADRASSDHTPTLETATQVFAKRHPCANLAYKDILAVTKIANHVSARAAALVATGVHALWQLHCGAEDIAPDASSSRTLVAYNGSVLENYPGFKERCQMVLDGLVEGDGGVRGSVELVYAEESSLLGAAVAGAVAGCEV